MLLRNRDDTPEGVSENIFVNKFDQFDNPSKEMTLRDTYILDQTSKF